MSGKDSDSGALPEPAPPAFNRRFMTPTDRTLQDHQAAPASAPLVQPIPRLAVPLLSGAGIKGKVLGALAHGIPCVLSPAAAEGVGLRHGFDCMIVEKPEEWAGAIRRLYDDEAFWTTLSDNGRQLIAEQYSFDRGRVLMRAAFEAVDMYSPR